MSLGVAGVLLAFLVSLSAPLVVRPVLARLGTLDVPSERSSHTTPVLRGGGVAPLLGVIAGTVFLIALQPAAIAMGIILGASTAIALLGLAEDIRGLGASIRLGAQLLIGAGATAALVAVSATGWWWAVPVGAIFIAAYTNAANFMDGINGISALHGLIAGSAFGLAGMVTASGWLAAVGFVIAAAFIAFLPWNASRRRIFLGDVGSYLLGGSLSIIAVAAVLTGLPVLTALAPFAIYIADTGVTLGRRALRREPVFEPHRQHVYQRLVDAGSTHAAADVVVSGATIVCAAAGFLALIGPEAGTLGALAIVAIVATYLLLPRLAQRR